MADRRGILIPLLIVGFIFFSPSAPPGARFESGPTIQDVIREEERSLAILRNSTYGGLNQQDGDLYNLTGLEADRGFAWDGLPLVEQRAQEQLVHALGQDGLALLSGESTGLIPALYHNVSGYIQGKWVRSKAQESVAIPQLNLSNYAPEGPFGVRQPRPFERNFTGTDGDVRLRFHQRAAYADDTLANITGISAELTLVDRDSGEEADLQVYGVYLMHLGQAVLSTTSDKFAGIFMLPHFALSNHTFSIAKAFLNESIPRTMKSQQEGSLDRLNPWSSQPDGTPPATLAAPQCEMILYLQQLPPRDGTAAPSSTTTNLLGIIEQEMRFPTGALIPLAPPMRFSMIAFSPDCGFILESKGPPEYLSQEADHLNGPKAEMLFQNGRRHVLLFALALCAEIVLLMQQMREANTPSTRSRISFSSIAMMALGDGYVTMTFLLLSLFISGVWIDLVGTAFLAFMSVSFFGMRFMMDVWTSQAPERAQRAREEAEQERERQQRVQEIIDRLRAERAERLAAEATQTTQTEAVSEALPNANTTTAAAPGSLLLPVTARPPTDTGAAAVFMPSDQEGLEPITGPNIAPQGAGAVPLREPGFGSVYVRFYFLLLATLFVSLNATVWPQSFRRPFFTLLAFIYLSFWVPQILRNVRRNCRHALEWRFVAGQSVLRLLPFAYFYGYEHNVLFAVTDYYSLGVLAVWVWIQVVILVSQEIIGPRWFIRKDWAPPAYDYHPVLREDEEGATMPIGFSEASTGSAPTSPIVERRASLSSPTARRGSSAKETKTKGKRIFDCAICFQELEVPVVEAGGSSDTSLGAGLLARRSYMVTPCRHIFHSTCLQGWMKYRLQCPICRETLPPL